MEAVLTLLRMHSGDSWPGTVHFSWISRSDWRGGLFHAVAERVGHAVGGGVTVVLVQPTRPNFE